MHNWTVPFKGNGIKVTEVTPNVMRKCWMLATTSLEEGLIWSDGESITYMPFQMRISLIIILPRAYLFTVVANATNIQCQALLEGKH